MCMMFIYFGPSEREDRECDCNTIRSKFLLQYSPAPSIKGGFVPLLILIHYSHCDLRIIAA